MPRSGSWMRSKSRFGSCLSMPQMGAPRTLKNRDLEGLRAWPAKGFDEIYIFYLTEGETVRVIRVLHGRRDIERILRQESVDDDAPH